VTKVFRIIENSANCIKFLPTKNTIITILSYIIIIIIRTKKSKTCETWKFINIIINKHFQTPKLKKSNDVCLAGVLLGCGDSVNWQFG
jgi:hypothetical protein